MTHVLRKPLRSIAGLQPLLLSASYLALGFVLWTSDAFAQPAAETQPGATPLPPVVVGAPRVRSRRRAAGAQRAPVAAATPQKLPDTFDARTGTVGYISNSTSVATKTNTPLIDIPQSISVVTKDFIKDQAPTNFTDVTRYVPGLPSIRARATATNWSFVAWTPARTSS